MGGMLVGCFRVCILNMFPFQNFLSGVAIRPRMVRYFIVIFRGCSGVLTFTTYTLLLHRFRFVKDIRSKTGKIS